MEKLARAACAVVLAVGCSSTTDVAGPASPDAGADVVVPDVPDAPQPIVGPCDNLGMRGRWQRITPDGVINSQALALDPFHVGRIWLGTGPHGNAAGTTTTTGKGGLFMSPDCGASWSHVNDGDNGPALDTASIWSMAIDYLDPRVVIYAVGADGGPHGLLKSIDGGKSWRQLFPAGSAVAQINPDNHIASVSMDPVNPRHLVVGMHTDCTGAYAPNCQAESTDGGDTWNIMKVPGAMWHEGGGPQVLDANSWIYTAPFDGMFLTEDRGANWREITPTGVIGATNGESTHRPLRRAPDGSFYLAGYKQDGSGGGLLQSADGRTWSVVPSTPHSSVGGGAIAFDMNRIFLADRDSMGYQAAQLTALDQWMSLGTPDGLVPIAGNGEGGCYLEYDDVHRVLYSSNFEGGLWRLAMPP
jgi:photosystem II stability/assembly factor-like uncharacterized protein